MCGTQATVSLKMKNTAEIRGFQFDLYLPEGMTVVKSSRGRIQGALSEGRLPDEDERELTFSEQADGAIRFLCSSLYDETFTGNDGEIATLQVNVAENMADGNYPVVMKHVKLTETDISKFYETEEIETTVTITSIVDNRTLLDEESTAVPAQATNANVRVKRTINANEWSTICLPFAMSAAQVDEAFGSEAELGDFTGCDTDDATGNIKVKFVPTTVIAANHPYIIRVSQPVTEFTVDGVDIVPDDALSIDKNQTGSGSDQTFNSFIGNYVNGTEIPDYAMFLYGNKFNFSTGKTKIKAFRGYFDFATAGAKYGAARLLMVVDEPTVIESLETERIEEVYYNVNGQKVNTPAKGIYIKEGKKVVVK